MARTKRAKCYTYFRYMRTQNTRVAEHYALQEIKDALDELEICLPISSRLINRANPHCPRIPHAWEDCPPSAYGDYWSRLERNRFILPKKYTQPKEKWSSWWLLEETNTVLRRLLIQVLGYEKICQDLEAKKLDSWREYSLLKIPIDLRNEEDIYLLKMICPSTGHIHVLRVPPDVKTCHEAITWINWGIAPKDFAVET